MRILSLDTSTSTAVLALMDGATPLAEMRLAAGQKRGERIADALRFLLAQADWKPEDVEGYAVGLGPGSFTGLRTGLALVKGLVIAHPRPVVGVSTLHALALNAAGFNGAILPLIDARKGQVFTARFRSDGQGAVARETEDAAVFPQDLDRIAPEPALLLGDGLRRYGELIAAHRGHHDLIAPEGLWSPAGPMIAELARPRLDRGETDPIESLVPIYVRSSDAELGLGAQKSSQ